MVGKVEGKNDFRQGEVRLKQVGALPKGLTASNAKSVLAVGKSTLHSHRLTGRSFKLFEGEGGKRFLRVTGSTSLVHEEHDAIRVPKGVYEVRIQREWSPRGEARKVED